MNHEPWMRLALEEAGRGVEAGQSPFGACIVRGQEKIVAAHNVVLANTDSTAHAEIEAIRLACRTLRTIDLSGCVIYSTCEPCPMCFAACHWARLDRIVYAASVVDAQQAGFNELHLGNAQMKRLGGATIQIIGGVLRAEGEALFARWQAREGRRAY